VEQDGGRVQEWLVPPLLYVPVNLTTAALLAIVSSSAGLSAGELGLSRAAAPRGVVVGVAVGAAFVAGIAVGAAVPPYAPVVRGSAGGGRGHSRRAGVSGAGPHPVRDRRHGGVRVPGCAGRVARRDGPDEDGCRRVIVHTTNNGAAIVAPYVVLHGT
jgi:hypothetical protein